VIILDALPFVVSMYLYRCTHICIYLTSSLSVSLSRARARACVRAHTHKLARTYKHTHTYIHANIHTRSLSSYTHRCAVGTYSPISGANSSTLCQKCTPSSTSPLASTSASDCVCFQGCCISLSMYTDMDTVFIHTRCTCTLCSFTLCVCTCLRGGLGELGYCLYLHVLKCKHGYMRVCWHPCPVWAFQITSQFLATQFRERDLFVFMSHVYATFYVAVSWYSIQLKPTPPHAQDFTSPLEQLNAMQSAPWDISSGLFPAAKQCAKRAQRFRPPRRALQAPKATRRPVCVSKDFTSPLEQLNAMQSAPRDISSGLFPAAKQCAKRAQRFRPPRRALQAPKATPRRVCVCKGTILRAKRGTVQPSAMRVESTPSLWWGALAAVATLGFCPLFLV
jgi:hypothetical protein